MKAIKSLLPLALVTTAHATISLTFDSSAITSGNTVDAYDTSGPQLSTSYIGTWADSDTGASGSWTFSVTDQEATDVVSFVQVPTVQDLPAIAFGQGIQFVIDGSRDGLNESNPIDFTFSYTVDNLGTGSTADFGAAFAAGPNGAGNFDNNGGTLSTGGTVFDLAGGASPNYDPLSGSFSTNPSDTGATSSNQQNWTILFEGTNEVTYNGTIDDIDTFVFGIGAVSITTPIPEPSSTALLGLGTLALIVRRRR